MSEKEKPAPKRETVGGKGVEANVAIQDEFSQYGGSYLLDEATGKRTRVEGPKIKEKEAN